MISFPLLGLSLLAAQFAVSSAVGAVLLCLVWGALMSATTLFFQTTVIKKTVVPDVANSLYSVIFNVGIGGGALMGNKIFNAFSVSAVSFGGQLRRGCFGGRGFYLCRRDLEKKLREQ